MLTNFMLGIVPGLIQDLMGPVESAVAFFIAWIGGAIAHGIGMSWPVMQNFWGYMPGMYEKLFLSSLLLGVATSLILLPTKQVGLAVKTLNADRPLSMLSVIHNTVTFPFLTACAWGLFGVWIESTLVGELTSSILSHGFSMTIPATTQQFAQGFSLGHYIANQAVSSAMDILWPAIAVIAFLMLLFQLGRMFLHMLSGVFRFWLFGWLSGFLIMLSPLLPDITQHIVVRGSYTALEQVIRVIALSLVAHIPFSGLGLFIDITIITFSVKPLELFGIQTGGNEFATVMAPALQAATSIFRK